MYPGKDERTERKTTGKRDLTYLLLAHTEKPYYNILEKNGVTHLILDAPTLYESGENEKCTAVIAVLADETLRKNRILKRDNLTKEQLESRLKAAKPDGFYLEKAEHIVYNNGDILPFKAEVTEILKKYKER